MESYAGKSRMKGTNGSFVARSERRISVSPAKSKNSVDTLYGEQVILYHVNDPELAYTQTVILTLVKTLQRVGV
jgi:hypothetical protein